jgi:hypothetical protein
MVGAVGCASEVSARKWKAALARNASHGQGVGEPVSEKPRRSRKGRMTIAMLSLLSFLLGVWFGSILL